MTANHPILWCKAVKKVYQDGAREVPVLDSVDLSVKTGERVAIVGRSGSGKTTLMNMLGGLEVPTSGQIKLANTELHSISERKRGYLRNRVLGLVFQFHHLLPEFTALENVCMPLLIRGMSVSKTRKLSLECLEKVGLGHRVKHKPSTLSGGERQRVAIARALVSSPQCILADEPTGNLDQESAEHVYELMMNLTREIGTSFIVVTHDLALAKRMDRIVSLENGCLKEVNL